MSKNQIESGVQKIDIFSSIMPKKCKFILCKFATLAALATSSQSWFLHTSGCTMLGKVDVLKLFFWLKTNPRTKLCTLEYVRLISRVIISLKIDEKDFEKFQNPLLGKSKLFIILLLDTIFKIFFLYDLLVDKHNFNDFSLCLLMQNSKNRENAKFRAIV